MNYCKISFNRSAVKRYLVFFSFGVLTLVFWLMNKLAGEYTVVLRIIPKINSSSAIYSDAADNTLYVQVKASGFFVLRKNFVPENIFYFTPENVSKQSMLKIPTAGLKESLREYFNRDLQMLSIEPDTIYFKMSEHVSKKVPVTAGFNLSFREEFRQSVPTMFFPDSVTVTGTKKDVENMHAVSLPAKKYTNVDRTIEDILTLTPMSNVVTSHSKIRYKIPVERCTEGTVFVPVEISNLPKTVNLILLPSKVKIKYTAPVKDYKQISDTDFSAEVNYLETATSLSRQLRVKIARKPDFVISTVIDPCFVEFLIQK